MVSGGIGPFLIVQGVRSCPRASDPGVVGVEMTSPIRYVADNRAIGQRSKSDSRLFRRLF